MYGVSVGPGDPELLTIKAMNILKKVKVIATPRTGGKKTMALDIVKQVVDLSKKEVIYLDFEMKKDKEKLAGSHRKIANCIEEYLKEGIDIAMLNLGDASLYSTYSYIHDIVENDGFETITIPGVTSFCAAAALLGKSLTVMDMPMTIIPGKTSDFEKQLEQNGTKVIMKPASAVGAIKELLNKTQLLDKSVAVCDCGLDTQMVYEDIKELPEKTGYFVTILVQN